MNAFCLYVVCKVMMKKIKKKKKLLNFQILSAFVKEGS